MKELIRALQQDPVWDVIKEDPVLGDVWEHLTPLSTKPLILAWSYCAGQEIGEEVPTAAWASMKESVEEFEAPDKAWRQKHLLVKQQQQQPIPTLPGVKWCYKVGRCCCGENIRFAWMHTNLSRAHGVRCVSREHCALGQNVCGPSAHEARIAGPSTYARAFFWMLSLLLLLLLLWRMLLLG